MKLLLMSMLFVGIASAQAPRPQGGYVPDEATAIKVAEAILTPIYGIRQIESEQPFRATLSNGVWKVEGTLHYDVGGVAVIRIDKRTAAVLSYIHYK